MKKLLVILLALFIIGFFGSAFVVAAYEVFGVIGVVIVILVFVGIAALLYLFIKGLSLLSEKSNKTNAAKKTKSEIDIKETAIDDNRFLSPATFSGSVQTTSSLFYDNVSIYRPKGACGEMPEVGETIYFVQDPQNPYDSEAIKAYYINFLGEDVIAGYMNRTKLRDMVRDWLIRGDKYSCEVVKNDRATNLILNITFYR